MQGKKINLDFNKTVSFSELLNYRDANLKHVLYYATIGIEEMDEPKSDWTTPLEECLKKANAAGQIILDFMFNGDIEEYLKNAPGVELKTIEGGEA